MAFPLFPKSPGKNKAGEDRAKPELAPRHDARGKAAAPVSARELAASVTERSAPAWEERTQQSPAGAKASPGGYFALSAKLSAANATQIEHMLAASQKQSKVRLDLGSLTGADDVGAKLLASALAKLRKRQYALV